MKSTWTKSSKSTANSQSVEVKETDDGVILVRSTRFPKPYDPMLAFDSEEWEAFVEAVKAGEFDL